MGQPTAPDPSGRATETDRSDQVFLNTKVGLPSYPVLMRWLLLGRIVLAVVTLIQAALSFNQPADLTEGLEFARYVALISVITVALALVVTAYAGYVVFVLKDRPSLGFLQSQAAMDLLLVTSLVHFAGVEQSGWAALYVLVIATYGILMPLRSGVVMALFGAVLFLANASFAQPARALSPGLWGQVIVFALVFIFVAFSGHRLRAAAEEQTQLATELEQVRFEADEILRNIRSGVMTVNSRGELAFINPTAHQILGVIDDTMVGRPIMAALETLAPELHLAIAAGIARGRRVARAEGAVHRADGRTFPIGLSTTTFQRERETVPSVTAIFSDISDAQYMRELHIRAERLEAVAALSASLAHEIRNPLASIRSAVEQLAHGANRVDPDERLLGDLVLRESDRLSRLLGEFLDFSRVRASHFRSVNLLTVSTDAARLIREHPECGPGVEISISGPAILVEADEDLIHRTVWNLMLNAAQAMRGAGRIRVEIDVPPVNELPRGADFDPVVRLRVSDDGPGIDPEVEDRLFQPFVSGRPGGSGLGLAIVQRAVEAHRGLVLVESAPGMGTTFTILLHPQLTTEEVA